MASSRKPTGPTSGVKTILITELMEILKEEVTSDLDNDGQAEFW